jgi:multiple sugar transport system permease protein
MRNLRALNVPTSLMALVIAFILLFPLYWMLMSSVLPSSVILSLHPPLFPPLSAINFESYSKIFMHSPILLWFYNSLVITIGSAVFSMVIATLAGYSLSRYKTRGQAIMGFFLLVNRMLPGTLLIIPLFIMFSKIHMLNNPLSVILANITAIVPFATWMMKGFFDTIPNDLEEAASVDGCSRLETLYRVILPLTLPGFAATGIYSAVLAWSDFLFSRTLLTQNNHWTMTIGAVSFIGDTMIDWSSLMAVGMIAVIPMVIVFFFLEPFLVSGMTSGSVK